MDLLPIHLISSSVNYFTPLHVDTNIEYCLDMEKFPDIDKTSHHREPALGIALETYTEGTSASAKERFPESSQNDLFSLIETLDMDDFPVYDDEEVPALNLFEDSSICLDISPVTDDNQASIHFFTSFPVSEAILPTFPSNTPYQPDDIVSSTALVLDGDIQQEVTEQGKRKQNAVAILDMSRVEYCKRQKIGSNLTCDFTKDIASSSDVFRTSDTWTSSVNFDSLCVLTGSRES